MLSATAGFGQKRSFNGQSLKGQMNNLILEKTNQVRWYTNLRDVLEAANIAPQGYDWYVSDIETNWRPPGFSWDGNPPTKRARSEVEFST